MARESVLLSFCVLQVVGRFRIEPLQFLRLFFYICCRGTRIRCLSLVFSSCTHSEPCMILCVDLASVFRKIIISDLMPANTFLLLSTTLPTLNACNAAQGKSAGVLTTSPRRPCNNLKSSRHPLPQPTSGLPIPQIEASPFPLAFG